MNTTISRPILREYLLGQSFVHVLVRFAFILIIIGLIWCALTFLLTLHNQYRKKQQLIQETNTSTPSNKPRSIQFRLLSWTRTKENSFPDDQLQDILEQQSSPPILPPLPIYRTRPLSIFTSVQELRMSKPRCASLNLPLVMITDTNLSHTNILELDTFDDHCRTLTDLQKQLIRQAKATCRPRFST